ncbi:MAG: MFS transporter, partial [Candidatus Bathyarchaeia archaeon]
MNRQTRNYTMLLIYSVLSSIFGTGWWSGVSQQYIPLYIVALGATPAMLGLLRSIGSAARSGISTPMGWIMDRYNLKKLMLIGMILQYVPSLVYILAGDIGFYFWWAIPSRIIEASARTLTMFSITLLIAESLRDEDRATGYSVRMTFSSIPGLITPMLWAFIVATCGGINVSGIRPIFFIRIIGHTVLILWIYLKLDVSNPRRLPNPDGKRPPTMKRLLSFLSDLRETFKVARGTQRWILIACFDIYCFSSIMGFTQLFAVEVKGADPFILGLMGTAVTATTLLLTVPMGRLGDKIGRKKIIYIGLPPTYAWILLLLYAPSSIYLVVSWIFYGIARATFPVWSTITMELVPDAHRGRFSGVRGLFTNLVSIPGSLVAGLMWTIFGPRLPFLVALASESVAVILAKTIPETLKKGA